MILPLAWSNHLPPVPFIPHSLQSFGFSGILFVWSFNSEECCCGGVVGSGVDCWILGGDSRVCRGERLVRGVIEGAQTSELTSRESGK